MTMIQQLQWREPYVSKGLNTKLGGILPHGVYRGYVVTAKAGMVVSVSPEAAYPRSVAVVDRDGYSITVTSDEVIDFTVPEGTDGEHFLCIHARYLPGGGGFQELVLLTEAEIEDYHIILAKLTIPVSTTIILQDMISTNTRTVGTFSGSGSGVMSPQGYYMGQI